MKVVVFVKATRNSEAGSKLPKATLEKLFADMGAFNERLLKAGIIKAGEGDGLKPSKFGKRLRFDNGFKNVVDGPFAETKELVAGYWVWEVKSVEEAVEWAKQCPDPMPGEASEIEIRPCFTEADIQEMLKGA